MKINARKATNPSTTKARVYEIDLHLTHYDKGNAFSRGILPGLGQMRVDGVVSMFQMPRHMLIGKFTLKKAFAWGGIYGSATSIEDIEATFADGVAAAVTEQQKGP